MSSDQNIPLKVRRAASAFQKQRASYYAFLADMLMSTKGETKILTMFERDAERYANQPRGILAAYWVDVYSNNGSNLAAAWQGTLPDDEVSIIRVAQDAGGGALEAALGDVARVAKLVDRVKKEVRSTMMAAVIGITIAVVMATVFPMFSAKRLSDIYSFIPFDQWGPKGTSLVNYSNWVASNGLFLLFVVALTYSWVHWSVNGWVGKTREWADSKIILYKAVRDIKGALFLATLSTLTRKRGNVMFTLRESLGVFAQSVRSPWLRWRVDEILERVDQTGAVNSDAFDTNMLSKEMFYYLRDMQEAKGFSEGFAETGRHVEGSVVDSLVARMTIYRWALLLTGVVTVISIMGWQFSVINEMRGVMQIYYSSK